MYMPAGLFLAVPSVPCNFVAVPAVTPGLRETQTSAAAQLRDSFAALVFGVLDPLLCSESMGITVSNAVSHVNRIRYEQGKFFWVETLAPLLDMRTALDVCSALPLVRSLAN